MTEENPSNDQPIGKPGPKPGPRDWSKSPVPSRRCHAHKKTGEQCKNSALAGQQVCKYHGGAAPQTLAKARQRLEAAADRMAARLLGIAESENVPAYVALQAVNSVLDRTGITEPKRVEMTVSTPFDQLYGDVMTGGSRADYRRSIGHPDPEPQSLPMAEHDDPHRPGGPRVLASHPDGAPYIIDGELSSSDRNADGSDDRAGADVDHQGDESLRQTLAKPTFELTAAQSGYLPTDIAMEQAAAANRNHRAKLERR